MWRGRLAFVNSIPGVDYPQLLPPLVQYTGPVVDVKKMEPFPAEVEAWIESVPDDMPIVYVSYGTIVRLTPERVAATIAALTSTTHYTLWALPKPQQVGLPDTLPPSIMIHHWIPTARALAHPKVKAFVSHCGGNSAVESMAMGKPLIGYPQFGDQMAVCRRIADAGAGITGPQGGWVQVEDVRQVLGDARFAARARTMSRLLDKFGGTSRAADLLELAAAGDLEPLKTPLEGSASSFFYMGGYDLLIYAQLLMLFFFFLCLLAELEHTLLPVLLLEEISAISARKYHFLVVGVPLSPLHNCVSIAQELCLRGHNVTVMSFADRGRQKVAKYSPKCKLNYISLGELPVSDDKEEALVREMLTTNSTIHQISFMMKNVMTPYFEQLPSGVSKALEAGEVQPDFALLGLPFGLVGRELQKRGIDFAVNVPTILVPPLNPWASSYVPLPFYLVNPHNMTFVDRLAVIGGNSLLNFGRNLAVAAGFQFSFMPDLSPDMWRGRLAFVNSIPGVDYPQLLPPLVQYTGPVVDVKKMEPFPAEVESWIESVPDDMPIVYVSYGTIVRLTPERVAAAIAALTSTTHYTLWALPKPQQVGLPDTLPPSIMIHHWIPTARALAHPKVKAFVSHCGGNSAVESMAMGKPLIGYPQFGDQMAVCRRIADAGAGVTGPQGGWVQVEDVRQVLGDPRFAARARSPCAYIGQSSLLELSASFLVLSFWMGPWRSFDQIFFALSSDVAITLMLGHLSGTLPALLSSS
ncbi:UGT2B4 [Symbiodinium pilosum]|uniref:UGT2B4 protein n=1 Tax=Symbiodinium pilosum TaxID=2952 RepID=A0A812KCW1_SYMPI|nr:UGT2B4 [Symbiodinium pilosum]